MYRWLAEKLGNVSVNRKLSVGFGLAVMATVLAGRRMPVRPIPKNAPQAPQAQHNGRP